LDGWSSLLSYDDPDRDFILQGVSQGFDIIDKDAPCSRVELDNHQSASPSSSFYHLVDAQVKSEIANGNYVPTLNPPKIVSPLGAIPKPEGGIRLIHDCSRPAGAAVNDYVSDLEHHRFSSVDDAAKLVKQNYFMAKVDLKSAYRSVSISSSSCEVTGIKWWVNDQLCYFYDSKLPFGAKRAPGIFHRLSSAVVRIMSRLNCNSIVSYLDDFFICEPTSEKCANSLRLLIAVLRRLGFAVNWNKVIDPTKIITFLGIEIDSTSMVLRLPDNKLEALNLELNAFANKPRASKKQLQSLAGKLNWASSVVKGGRIYMRRIIDAICLLKRDHHKIRLRAGVLADISWWLAFMPNFNGISAIIDNSRVAAVYADACGQAGAAVWGAHWLHIGWQREWPEVADCHINEKEVLAAASAVALWGHMWRDHVVYIFSDNSTTVSCINKNSSKNTLIMQALRFLFWQSATFNFKLKAIHIPGKNNVLADRLSRLHELSGPAVLECLYSISDTITFPCQCINKCRLYDLCYRSTSEA
jgi:hypothetical protein